MKYYFWILGCAMNYSDAERISAIFDSLGYTKTDKESEADLVCVIACSVRQHAVDRIFGKAKEWNETKKKRQLITVLSGCVLEKDRKKMRNIFDIMFEIKDLHMLPEILSSIIDHGSKNSPKAGEYLSIIPNYSSSFRAYVPISTGCNNFCTYCAVPYTRGREKSRPIIEIVNEIKVLVKKGYKEITLLGQNVNSFGNDLPNSKTSTAFGKLVQEIDKIPGNYRVYFYSNHPKDISDDLINILPNLVHFPHYLHLPLQSGNDDILKAMNRHYTQKQYLELVKKIRNSMPDILLTTDIIVGFPGETEEQFLDTLRVVEKAKFEMIFLAQFSPRPGTRAAKMTDSVSKAEKKNRDMTINKTLTSILDRENHKLIGTTQEILVDETKNDKLFGRTRSYKVVEIKKSPTIKAGDFIKVKIDASTAWKLFGVRNQPF